MSSTILFTIETILVFALRVNWTSEEEPNRKQLKNKEGGENQHNYQLNNNSLVRHKIDASSQLTTQDPEA